MQVAGSGHVRLRMAKACMSRRLRAKAAGCSRLHSNLQYLSIPLERCRVLTGTEVRVLEAFELKYSRSWRSQPKPLQYVELQYCGYKMAPNLTGIPNGEWLGQCTFVLTSPASLKSVLS